MLKDPVALPTHPQSDEINVMHLKPKESRTSLVSHSLEMDSSLLLSYWKRTACLHCPFVSFSWELHALLWLTGPPFSPSPTPTVGTRSSPTSAACLRLALANSKINPLKLGFVA